MLSGNPDHPQKSLTTKQGDDNKFFSKHLSKESSIANPSLRVYYGGLPANVPFVWESQPGTPKYTFSEDTLPPLTPPPSYYSNKIPTKKHSGSNLLRTLFLKISLKKTKVPSSPSLPSLSSSSMFSPLSNSSVNPTKYHGRSRFSSNASFDSMGDYEEEDVGSPTSTLCFRFRRVSTGGNRGCHGF